MKNKLIILFLFFVLIISACDRKEEAYESKAIEVESVFDKLEKSETKDDEIETEKYSELSDQKDETEDSSEEDENSFETEDTINKSKMTIVNLNLRSSPEIREDNILMVIPSYTNVNVIKEDIGPNKEWAKIEINGYEGYVDGSSLTDI